MSKPVLVFDLDGTLVDTAADLIATLNVRLAAHGLDPLPVGAVRSLVGHGARHTLKHAFIMAEQPLAEDQLDEETALYIEHYGGRVAELSRPFPGALTAMAEASLRGWTMAVCTNKTEGLARLLLTELGLANEFAAITGGDTFAFRKPDPRHLTETLALAARQPDRAVMVGDSETDIKTAQAAGIPVVAVTFGYSPQPVRTYGPDRVIDHFSELWDCIDSLDTLERADTPP